MEEAKTPPEPIKGDTSMIDMKIIIGFMEGMQETLREEIRGISARVALLQRDSIKMTDAVTAMATDFQNARVKRLEEEIAQFEKERGILESRLQILNEQLDFKKGDSVQAVNTTDKIRVVATAAASQTLEDQERLEKAEQEELWKKRREAAITAVITWGSVGLVASILGFLWWLFMFYMNNR